MQNPNTMASIDWTHRLYSSWSHFPHECNRLKIVWLVFSRLKYPKHPVNLLTSFVDWKVCDQNLLTDRWHEPSYLTINWTTKSQQMLWSEPESTHHNPACVCEPENPTRTKYEWKKPPIVNQQCLFIDFNATCVMQAMQATHADILHESRKRT